MLIGHVKMVRICLAVSDASFGEVEPGSEKTSKEFISKAPQLAIQISLTDKGRCSEKENFYFPIHALNEEWVDSDGPRQVRILFEPILHSSNHV